MKLKSTCLLLSAFLPYTGLSYGGDSSAGGGGGSLRIVSGFNNQFTAELHNNDKGVIQTILKTMIAGGAIEIQKQDGTTAYVMPNNTANAVSIQHKQTNPSPSNGPSNTDLMTLKLSFVFGFTKLFQLTHSHRQTTPFKSETVLHFGDEFAEFLYQGMSKSGASIIGYTSLGPIYLDNDLRCENRDQNGIYTGPQCFISVSD